MRSLVVGVLSLAVLGGSAALAEVERPDVALGGAGGMSPCWATGYRCLSRYSGLLRSSRATSCSVQWSRRTLST
jgi:hypothetical protein